MGVVLPAAASGLLLPGQLRPVPPSYLAVPNGLVGYWGLDPDCLNFTAGKAFDLSGNGLTGTLNSLTAASLVNGQVGTGLSFSSSYIDLGAPASLDFTGPCSAAAWVYRTGSGIQILNKGFNGGVTQYQFQYDGVSKIQFNMFNGASHGVTSASASTANVWEHWVGTFNGASWRVYKNGALDATSADAQGPTHTNQNAAIGGIFVNGTPGQFWTGNLDDIRAYNRALDPWEVMVIYQAGLAGQRHSLLAMPEDAEMDVLMLQAAQSTLMGQTFLSDFI